MIKLAEKCKKCGNTLENYDKNYKCSTCGDFFCPDCIEQIEEQKKDTKAKKEKDCPLCGGKVLLMKSPF